MQRTDRLESWISSYGNDHRNPVNHAIHMVCIPLIAFSSLGLLNWIPAHLTLLNHAVGFGHGLYEKNRPSLMSNLVFLFIAPAFMLDGLMGGGTAKQS